LKNCCIAIQLQKILDEQRSFESPVSPSADLIASRFPSRYADSLGRFTYISPGLSGFGLPMSLLPFPGVLPAPDCYLFGANLNEFEENLSAARHFASGLHPQLFVARGRRFDRR